MTPRVSVVMCFLDEERFLGEAIESVLAQTYRDWELLLVDDGSRDGSAAIAEAYAAQHPARISCHHHEGHVSRGQSAARNLGVARSRGDLIAFLDADDVWLPDTVANQVSLLDRYPEASLVYGSSELWYSWTGEPGDVNRDLVYPVGFLGEALVRPPELLRLVLESRAPTPSPSAMCVRRATFDRVGRFEETFTGFLSMFEDQVLVSKLFLADTVVVCERCFTRYRQHPDSVTARGLRAGQKYPAGLAFLDWLSRYLTEQGVGDPRLWRALRKKRWRYRHPKLDGWKRRIGTSVTQARLRANGPVHAGGSASARSRA